MIKLSRKLNTIINNPLNVLSMTRRRLAAKFSYYACDLSRSRALAPETINIYPTDRCNLKCSMCFVKFKKPKPEMELTEWIDIINQIKKFKPRIHLSGGEPFIYPQIIDLISHIKKSELFLSITTNGTSLSEYAEEIMRLKVNKINISIDGPKESHDKIRGVEGTFDRIMAGLTQIKRLKRFNRLPAIYINSMINFTDEGASQEVIKIGDNIGAENIQFLHPMFVDTNSLLSHRAFLRETCHLDLNYWKAADITCNKPDNLNDAHMLLAVLKKESGISVEIFPSFNFEQLKAYYNMNSDFYSIMRGGCQAMWNTATILPSGDVESCPDYIIGNCREKDFFTLWNNEIMRALRYRIKRHHFFTVCRACCFFYM